jgi:AcrR family transcriptional regulator
VVQDVPTSSRERRHDRTRAAILDEALAVTHEGGAERIGIRELARRLDYSPSALYRYFASREDIIVALAEETVEMLAASLTDAARQADADPLVAVGEAYFSFAASQPERFRLLFAHLPSGRLSIDAGAPGRSPYLIMLGVIAAERDAGRVRPELDVEDLAYALWAMVHGMAVLESTNRRGASSGLDGSDELGSTGALGGTVTLDGGPGLDGRPDLDGGAGLDRAAGSDVVRRAALELLVRSWAPVTS